MRNAYGDLIDRQGRPRDLGGEPLIGPAAEGSYGGRPWYRKEPDRRPEWLRRAKAKDLTERF